MLLSIQYKNYFKIVLNNLCYYSATTSNMADIQYGRTYFFLTKPTFLFYVYLPLTLVQVFDWFSPVLDCVCLTPHIPSSWSQNCLVQSPTALKGTKI